MAFTSSQKTVASTATLLTTVPTDGVSGATVRIANRHATNSAFIGPAAVTITTGYELKTGETLTIDLDPGEALYGIAAVTGTVHVLESSV